MTQKRAPWDSGHGGISLFQQLLLRKDMESPESQFVKGWQKLTPPQGCCIILYPIWNLQKNIAICDAIWVSPAILTVFFTSFAIDFFEIVMDHGLASPPPHGRCGRRPPGAAPGHFGAAGATATAAETAAALRAAGRRRAATETYRLGEVLGLLAEPQDLCHWLHVFRKDGGDEI